MASPPANVEVAVVEVATKRAASTDAVDRAAPFASRLCVCVVSPMPTLPDGAINYLLAVPLLS